MLVVVVTFNNHFWEYFIMITKVITIPIKLHVDCSNQVPRILNRWTSICDSLLEHLRAALISIKHSLNNSPKWSTSNDYASGHICHWRRTSSFNSWRLSYVMIILYWTRSHSAWWLPRTLARVQRIKKRFKWHFSFQSALWCRSGGRLRCKLEAEMISAVGSFFNFL